MAHSSNHFIHGSTFNSAQGDFHIHNGVSESGLHTLLRLGVSLGAIHDSAERYPPPNCHPDTRKAVRQIILDWISDEILISSFFWLYGPAGAGKTAILQAIAEFLCNQSGSGQNFGGSFFFSRGKQGRDQCHFLFSTIAYQLALKVPGLRQHVNRIMELDPTLHTKSMNIQLQTLIVDAFQCLSSPPPHSYLVIVDGLDECHDKAIQQSILRLLCDMIKVHKLPLRFLIGSRPESHIRASFDQESLYTITHRVVLDETFNPGRDIRVFLRDGFAKISSENSILSHVEQPWPGEGIIDLLVQRSSGQFIYAATVLKFVGADLCIPTKQLALVLKPDPTAFSDLDQLYTQILSVYPSAVNVVKVLGIISVSHGDLAEAIEDIFEMEDGELELVLRGLSSLIRGNGEHILVYISYVVPHFAHASFSDYLFDSSRSGPFHVNRQEYEHQVVIRSFALLMQMIRSWRTPFITRVRHSATWDFFTSRLPTSFGRSPRVVKEAIMADINDVVQELMISSDVAVEASFFEMRRLFEILQKCFDIFKVPQSGIDDYRRIRVKFEMLLDEYQRMFDLSLSQSKDLGVILKSLPGVVVQKRMKIQGMAALYRIEPDLLKCLIKFTIDPLKPSSLLILDYYLSRFLQDRYRSQLYYCNPILQHISICRRFLTLLDRSDASFHDLSDYVRSHFYDHLCAATTDFLNAQNISDDHPAVEILRDLETTAYYIDESSSGRLARDIIQAILRWADMLNCRLEGVPVFVSDVDLMERVCHLTNKIYREVLCIARDKRMLYITIGGCVQVSTLGWTTQYRIALSWDLLIWTQIPWRDRILCSFTNFITTPELSGLMYISPDIYHTQITEYSLETILRNYSLPTPLVMSPNWTFRVHISRALPTEMIFYLLRSISVESLIRDCYGTSNFGFLEIIIKWLQQLGHKRPSDLYNHLQSEFKAKGVRESESRTGTWLVSPGRRPPDSAGPNNIDATIPTTIQVESEVTAETERSKRKRIPRKLVLDTLNGCLCGEVVDPLELPSDTIIKCNEMGCETQWYHLICVKLEIGPRKWLCAACEASGQTRGGKRPRR